MSLRRIVSSTALGAVAFCSFVLGTYEIMLADTKIEFQSSSGYTNNLYLDSTAFEDSFNKVKASINYYPLSKCEINLKNEYTYYGHEEGLSNFLGEVGFSFIPTSYKSALSVYLDADFNSQVYRKEYRNYNVDNYDMTFALGYSLKQRAQFRAGFSYKSARYTNEIDTLDPRLFFNISPDNDTYEYFAGCNITLPLDNVIDIEVGHPRMDLVYVEPPKTRDYLKPNKDKVVAGHIDAFYFSPRISRPVGSKSGINITYIYRDFVEEIDGIIPGVGTTSQFLSPWATIYEGEAVSMTVKTYVVPSFIIESGAGYWKKNYLKTEVKRKTEQLYQPPNVISDHHEEESKFFLSIRRPFVLKSDAVIEPIITLDYAKNTSLIDLYDYSNLSVAAGLTFRL
jgi:hypothetical protein